MVFGERANDLNQTRPAPPSGFDGVVRAARGLFRPRGVLQAELIATINEVADAVSSAMNVAEVLDVIIDRAKRITDTDKAVLVLADEHGETLDLDTIMVRGRRGQHEQTWWEARLNELADRVFDTGEPAIERHHEQKALLLCSPVLVKDRPIGLLCAINTEDRPFSPEQIDFLAILSAFAASAIENARLAEQSRYVLLASERDRIAREMHDGVVQSLFSISLGLEVCKKQVMRDPVAVGVRLDELQQQLNSSMTELRRFIYDLRPMKLQELGLVGALEFWVREITSGRQVRGKVTAEGDRHILTPAEEACLYRVAKEAVSNAVRHAHADLITVRLRFEPQVVRLQVADDGVGFDTTQVLDQLSERIGLRSIRERIRGEGGTLSIDSAPGAGTTLSVELPLKGGH